MKNEIVTIKTPDQMQKFNDEHNKMYKLIDGVYYSQDKRCQLVYPEAMDKMLFNIYKQKINAKKVQKWINFFGECGYDLVPYAVFFDPNTPVNNDELVFKVIQDGETVIDTIYGAQFRRLINWLHTNATWYNNTDVKLAYTFIDD